MDLPHIGTINELMHATFVFTVESDLDNCSLVIVLCFVL